MNLNHCLRLLLILVAFMPASQVSAQTSLCKDTAKHKQLQTEMWVAKEGNDAKKVYTIAKAFQKHTDDEGDLEGHYNAWMCGIAFNLDRMNICDAYQIAVALKNDLKNITGGEEEQYMGPMMMGQVYNVCGNVPGAIAELKEAIRLVKGTRYEESILHSLYTALAHLTLVSNPDQSLLWVEEGIKMLNSHKQSPIYQRGMGGACALRSIIYFKKHDYQNFSYWYDQAMQHCERPDGYSGIFMSYANIYKKAVDGHVPEALEAADSIASLKERYLMKCDLYTYDGEMKKAFDTQRELMLLNDSIEGTMMAENIDQMEREIQLMKHEQEMGRKMNIVLFVVLVLALLFILLMHRNIYLRRRYNRRLKAKNEELRAAYKQVAAADEMKTQFIRNVSHEIRTPLNIINGFSQVLTTQDSSLDEEERREVSTSISHSTRQITSLVNKMLALANESTKDLLKEVEPTDGLEICRKAIADMPEVDSQKIKVTLDDQTDGDTMLCTNGDSLLQMLDNILENATKFTEEGHIILNVRKENVEGRKMMLFTVEDTGCGIPADKVGSIFDRWMKVDEFKEGLGLGLAYCKETAQKLGGTLRLVRTSEQGTTFELGLPVEKAEELKKSDNNNKKTKKDESTNRTR